MDVIVWPLLVVGTLALSSMLWNRWRAAAWTRAPQPPGEIVRSAGNRWYVRVQGHGDCTVVIDSRLGGMSMEWWTIQDALSDHARVVTYDRAGYGWSGLPRSPRGTAQIANELHELLEAAGVPGPYLLVGHSQGGLNVQHFARLYPNQVAGVVLLDPISAENGRFKSSLSPRVYEGSGVDKSAGIRTMRWLAALGALPWLKPLLLKSPPFFYYKDMPPSSIETIWRHHLRAESYAVVADEYALAYTPDNRKALLERAFPDVPLTVIAHDPDVIVQEIVEYGGLSTDEAWQVERLWQALTRSHLDLSTDAKWLIAEKSSHMIHLDQPNLVIQEVRSMLNRLERAPRTAPAR